MATFNFFAWLLDIAARANSAPSLRLPFESLDEFLTHVPLNLTDEEARLLAEPSHDLFEFLEHLSPQFAGPADDIELVRLVERMCEARRQLIKVVLGSPLAQRIVWRAQMVNLTAPESAQRHDEWQQQSEVLHHIGRQLDELENLAKAPKTAVVHFELKRLCDEVRDCLLECPVIRIQGVANAVQCLRGEKCSNIETPQFDANYEERVSSAERLGSVEQHLAQYLSLADRVVIESGLIGVIPALRQNLRFRQRGMPLRSQVEAGLHGLYDAADRFDFDQGVAFPKNASWWTKNRTIKHSLACLDWKAHDVPLISRCVEARRRFETQFGRKPTNDELAEFADMSASECRRLSALNQNTAKETPVRRSPLLVLRRI
jgi:hypothetical protein